MTDQERAGPEDEAVLKQIFGEPDGRTHYEGCEREHHDCALARLEVLRAKLEVAEEIIGGLPKDPINGWIDPVWLTAALRRYDEVSK